MKRFLVLLLVAVLLGALAVVLWPSPGSSIGHTIRFSDGTTLTLKAVTCGTEHYYRGGLWRRLLRHLPPKLVARFVPQGDAWTTSRPSIVFWLARSGKPQPTGDLVLCDSTGFGVWGGYVMTYRGLPGAKVEGWAFEYWLNTDAKQAVATVTAVDRPVHNQCSLRPGADTPMASLSRKREGPCEPVGGCTSRKSGRISASKSKEATGREDGSLARHKGQSWRDKVTHNSSVIATA